VLRDHGGVAVSEEQDADDAVLPWKRRQASASIGVVVVDSNNNNNNSDEW